MKSTGAKVLFGLVLLIAVVISFVGLKNIYHPTGEIYRTYASPYKKYKIVVYRVPMLVGFPGQSGDASGYVQLQNDLGKVIQEKEVEMVQLIDVPTWSATNVEIKLFADWNLPK